MIDLQHIDNHIEQFKITLLEYYKKKFIKSVKDEEQVKEIIWKVFLYNTLMNASSEGINDCDIEDMVDTDFYESLQTEKNFLEWVELKENV